MFRIRVFEINTQDGSTKLRDVVAELTDEKTAIFAYGIVVQTTKAISNFYESYTVELSYNDEVEHATLI